MWCKMETITEEECLADIARALIEKKEGFRQLWVGYTGYGKTVCNARLAHYLIDNVRKLFVISTDQKNKEVLYPGEQVVLQTQIAKIEGQEVVIRGPAISHAADDEIDFEELAKQVWDMARVTEVPVALFVDELFDACSASQQWATHKGERKSRMERLYRQGRVMGISISATTQVPQEIPRLAYAMSDTVCIFRMDGREIEYLRRLGVIEDSDAEVLLSFTVGDFLLCKKGQSKKQCRFSL
jgi:KaiC/GvpD/RAD55 family RecA-like ATPase